LVLLDRIGSRAGRSAAPPGSLPSRPSHKAGYNQAGACEPAEPTGPVGSCWQLCHSVPTVPMGATVLTLAPFMNQNVTAPELLRHTMSAVLLPSMSPTPATVHSLPTTLMPADPMTEAPFISHMDSVPSSRRHKMSARPSLLKSATPTACHSVPSVPTGSTALTTAPFIAHRVIEPSPRRNRMSALPSPSKSATP